jgi:hypothetical protein
MAPRAAGRIAFVLGTSALAALDLTCARPMAAGGTAAAPAAPAAGAAAGTGDDGALEPLPALAKPPATTEHTELRALGKTIARHVDHGFETLIVSTGENIRCEGDRLDGGADVRIQGAADTRRPWSAWFALFPAHNGDPNAAPEENLLVVRRPLPARGEHQIAHVFLPLVCSGTPEHFRFALPDAEPQASDPRAMLTWVAAFARHAGGAAWGNFAVARLRELYPEPAPKPVAWPPEPHDARGGKLPPAASAAKGKAQGNAKTNAKNAKTKDGRAAGAARPSPPARAQATGRVTAPRRDPSELARLMDTTTGMTSLQETLQTDRALLATGDEPASVALTDLKPPSFKPHPWAAMTAALNRPVPSEPLATAAPAGFYFVRFRTITQLIRLREELDAGIAPALARMGEGADYDLAPRYEAELGLRQGPLTKLLGPTVVDDLAVVGSDPYLREGSDLSFVFRVRARPAFEAALAGTLAAFGAAHGGLKSSTVDHQGTPITVTRSSDGVVRRHRATIGSFDIVSNSLAATRRIIDAVAGREPRLADEPDFRYMLARDAATPADVLAFLGDRFVGEVIGPRQKVLEARRQIALAELSRPGYAALLYGWMYGRVPASADEVVASGLLRREELAHAGRERIDWQPGRAARSSWGAVGALTPLLDLPAVAHVTPSEKAAYDIFTAGYQSFWRTSIDPVAIRLALPTEGRGPLTSDVRVLPIITGTEYADLLRTVGHARVDLGDGGGGGLRTAIAIGPDAQIRRELGTALRELPLVGSLKVDWLGDWGILGIDDTATPAAREAIRKQVASGLTEPSFRDLIELPVYAGIEVRNMTAAVAFLAGVRTVLEQAAPGAIHWKEAGRERDVPFVSIRAGSSGGEDMRDLALYYSFCKSALVLSLSESALRHRIDDCLDGRQPRTGGSARPAAGAGAGAGAGKDGPQWILDMDMRERGPLWWRLALLAAGSGAAASEHWSVTAAEAVLRGAPGASPSVVRALARDTLGAIPATPEGYAYLLADDGVHDPLRGARRGTEKPTLADLLASDESPFVRLGRLIAHARSEVAFDDEGKAGGPGVPPPRSLHVRLRLGADRH